MTPNVALLCGSLRKESINRQLAQVLIKLAEGRLNLLPVEIGSLPLYNDDLWADPPEAVRQYKKHLDDAQAVLFVTPEYNRTVPGLLGNACDWGSRPYGKSSFAGKPAAVIGASPGAIGTAMAQLHMRANMLSLGMLPVARPEAFIQWKPDHYGPDSSVTNPETRAFLSGFVDGFAAHIARLV